MERQKSFVIEIFFSALLLAILHKAALEFSLYWTTDWFDILTHFLGGLTLGFIAIYVLYQNGWLALPQHHMISVFITVLSVVVIIGLVWELWELFMGFTDVLNDVGDTVLDVIVDIVGGATAFLYAKKDIIIHE